MGGYYFENHVIINDILCDVWLAHYFNNMRDITKFKALHPSSKITMWQFGADGYNTLHSGKDCGVSSSVIDENYCFVDYPTIIQNGGYNGHQIIESDIPEQSPPIIQTPSSSSDSSSPSQENSSSSSIEDTSSREDIPVFKPQEPTKPSSGCSASVYSVLGIFLLPLTIFSIVKLMKKEPF